MNTENICLSVMLMIGAAIYLIQPYFPVLVVVALILLSFTYFIYHLFYTNAHKEILMGMVIATFFILLTIIPFIGIILFILFVLYNISKTLESLKLLIPEILYSIALYATLTLPALFSINKTIYMLAPVLIYITLSIAYCKKFKNVEIRGALFLLSVMWLSVPLAIIMIISIINSLASLLKISIGSISRSVTSTQNVGGYMRAGNLVSGYTRNVSSTVVESAINITPGTGGMTSSVAKEIIEKAARKKSKEGNN